jgi:hypothetical protein
MMSLTFKIGCVCILMSSDSGIYVCLHDQASRSLFILKDERMPVTFEVVECLYTSIAESNAIYVFVYIVVDFLVYGYRCLLYQLHYILK